MNNIGDEGIGLWRDKDEFYYDVLNLLNGQSTPLKVRSMVGLIPLFALETLEPELLEQLPGFAGRLEWMLKSRPDLAQLFLKGEDGQRPVLKYHPKLATDPHFKDYVLFHEHFHGDNGRGVGASHQTGWTGLVAKLLQPRNMSAKETVALSPAKAAAKSRSQQPALVAA